MSREVILLHISIKVYDEYNILIMQTQLRAIKHYARFCRNLLSVHSTGYTYIKQQKQHNWNIFGQIKLLIRRALRHSPEQFCLGELSLQYIHMYTYSTYMDVVPFLIYVID